MGLNGTSGVFLKSSRAALGIQGRDLAPIIKNVGPAVKPPGFAGQVAGHQIIPQFVLSVR